MVCARTGVLLPCVDYLRTCFSMQAVINMKPSLMKQAKMAGSQLQRRRDASRDGMEEDVEEAYDTLQRYIHLGDDRHCIHTIVNGRCRTCNQDNCATEIPFHEFLRLFGKKIQRVSPDLQPSD